MVRCCICGRKLTADKSVARGIGPICYGKTKKESFVNREKQKPNRCKVCGYELLYVPSYDELKLPCNHYCCFKGHCPFVHEPTCPRERVYVKSDVYPLYKNKVKRCSFCGELLNGGYHRNFSKTKLTLECKDCRTKNKSWRFNEVEGYKTMSPKNLDIFIKNKVLELEK